jgi:hypothetical protein
MSERHVARCDAPECGKEEALLASTVSTQFNMTGGMPGSALTFRLPGGWQTINGATICSWACLARYAGAMADTQANRRKPS